jgi:hypothetical protein
MTVMACSGVSCALHAMQVFMVLVAAASGEYRSARGAGERRQRLNPVKVSGCAELKFSGNLHCRDFEERCLGIFRILWNLPVNWLFVVIIPAADGRRSFRRGPLPLENTEKRARKFVESGCNG